MKTARKYNRSEIMKRAWYMQSCWKDMSFSYCLKRAWDEAKKEQDRLERKVQREAEQATRYRANMEAASKITDEAILISTMESYYRSGVYSGD
ncbi:MAG: hypothetical protein LBL58_04455 [Tannerellaceae bacterium]|jgi:hypothetical protein|nr:hypothetical protein [Tannerellaceae bacterium]